MSKGDTPRPTNKEKFDESFERIFGRKELKTWHPDGKEESQDDVHSGDPDCRACQSGGGQCQKHSYRGSES